MDEEKMEARIYLEFCDGGDLQGIVEARKQYGPVHKRKIWKWFIGIIDALVYCHRGPEPEDERKVHCWNVVYHQDIKPGNILLKIDPKSREIVPKLADFGFSESIYSIYYTKHRIGKSDCNVHTMGYEAPECPNLSGATDVWGLAVSIACG